MNRWLLPPLVLVALCAGLLLPGRSDAPASAPAGSSTTVTLPEGSYVLHIPPGSPPAQGWPFLFADHGADLNAANMEAASGLDPAADAAGYVVIYGQAQNGRWDAGFCCVKPVDTGHRDDVDWHRLVAADAATRTQLNLNRGYAAGFSNGAMMAWRLACDAPDLVKAAVVVAGSLTTTCGVPVKVLRLHDRLRDKTVPYCQTPTVSTPRVGCPGYEGRVFSSAADVNKPNAGSVVQIESTAVGHAWPSGGGKRAIDWFTEVCNVSGTSE